MISCLLLLTLVGSASCEVMKLTTHNFSLTKKDNDFLLVFFHGEDCNYCDKVLGILRSIEEDFAETHPLLRYAYINLDDNETVKENEEVLSYPELRFYFHGEVFAMYIEAIDEKKIKSFINDHMEEPKPAKLIKGERDYQLFRNTQKAIYFGLPEVTDAFQLFCDNISRIFPDIPVFWAETHGRFDSRIVYDEDEKYFYHFKFKRNYDLGDKELTARDGFKTGALVPFIMKLTKPTVQILNGSVLNNILNDGIKAIVLFDRTLSSPLANRFEIAALKANFTAIFAKATVEESNAQILAKTLGLEESEFPAIRAVESKNGKYIKYKMEKELNQKNINNFFYDFGISDLKPYYKSGKYENNFGRDFHRYNRKQLMKVLDQGKKDLFVAYIGKWCPDCSGIQTVFADTIKKIVYNKDSIIFALVDVDENDVETQLKQQLPSVQLYRRLRSKQPLLFDKKLSVDGILDYLEDKLGKEFRGEVEEEEDIEADEEDSAEEVDEMAEFNQEFKEEQDL